MLPEVYVLAESYSSRWLMSDEQRSGTDRRKGERRGPAWRHKWQGVVAIIGAIGSLIFPVFDYLQSRARLEYQFQLDIKRAEVDLLKQQNEALQRELERR